LHLLQATGASSSELRWSAQEFDVTEIVILLLCGCGCGCNVVDLQCCLGECRAGMIVYVPTY